jgi:preprotein translocase subunit SecG
MQILSLIQIIVSLLLVIVILLQKTGADGISGIGGNNMGVMTAKVASNFLTKTTVVLIVAFMINAIILANLSNKSARKNNKIGIIHEKTELPIAK